VPARPYETPGEDPRETPIEPASPSQAGSSPSSRTIPGTLARKLIRAVLRDPYHFPERLVLIAHEQLADPCIAWATRAHARDPQATPTELAAELRTAAVGFARTNGALAGTPFLTALVPAYMSVLWEQARMTMKIAALNGRDPREPLCAAEILYLRGIYTTPEAAAGALARLDAEPATAESSIIAKLRSWVQLIYLVLVLAGILWAPDHQMREQSDRSRRAWLVSNAFAGLWLLITWVIPITCMVDMAHSCASDTRTLAMRAIDYYAIASAAGEHAGAPESARKRRRAGGHRLLLLVSLAIPLGLITLAVLDPVHHAHLVAISGFLGLAVVLALWGTASRTR
jgi:hypothetical protein